MAKKTIFFNRGIQPTAKIGTLVKKLAAQGFAAYAQNVNGQNDEYGEGVALPGPALTTIGNNTELSGAPIYRVFVGSSSLAIGYLYIAQAVIGVKTIIRRITGILTGSTPSIDSGKSMTVNHGPGHANQVIVDMVLRPDSSGNLYVYVAGKDDSDCWVQKFEGGASSPSLSSVVTNSNFTGGFTDQFLVLGSDNIIYWIGKNRVSSLDTSDTYTVLKLANGLPVDFYASCGCDWNLQLLVAGTTDAFGTFDRRKSGGSASVAIWDYLSPSYLRRVPAPCRYISALIPLPNGKVIAFGGVDEGKTSLYEFTGYGFSFIVSYIGDMPRSRHSVEVDSKSRISWQTVDGQKLRYNFETGDLEHLTSIDTDSSAGGFLAKAIGAPEGDEFLMGSGKGSTYTIKRVRYGRYIGDDNNASDEVRTPIRVSGTEVVPKDTSILSIELFLGKSLESGERVELRVYRNGTSDYTTYLTMDYNDDGSISSKREVLTVPDLNSYNLAVVWKQADEATSAPPVAYATVETNTTIT